MLKAVLIVLVWLGLTCATALAQIPQWPAVQAVPAQLPTETPEAIWRRIEQGQGLALTRPHQVIAASSGQAYWAGFRLGSSDGATNLWLSLQSPTQDEAQMWWRHAGGSWVAQPLLQDTRPLSLGSGHLFAVWPLGHSAGQSMDVLVRIEGVNRVQFPLVLQTPAEFVQQQQWLCLLMGAILVIPWVVVFYVLTLIRSFYNPSLPIFLAMALCETMGAVWVSGLMNWLLPWLDRLQTAWVGSVSYGLLMALSVHHARAFLRTPQHDPAFDKALRWGAWCWWLGLPLMAWFYSDWMRSALLYLGAGHSVLMLVLAVRTYLRYPRSYIAMYVAVWVVYLLSVAVYWLFRWFEWPLISTLSAQFVQGAMVAALLDWSGCMQVVQLRQGLQLRLHRHREQSRLYAAAQHDLWQPLQSMQLYAKSLSGASGQQQAHLLRGIRLASFYVDDFMLSLRHLADDKTRVLDAGQLQAHTLANLLQDMLQEFTLTAQLSKVRLRSRMGAQPVWLHPPTLQRMVRNMLSNALRHGSSGGKILLGTRRQGHLLWLWCIDNGEGMSQAQLDACFEAFTTHGEAQNLPQGLGLGLYSIKQLSVQMNTPVRLRSLSGKGTAIGVGLRLTSPRPT
jgi:signal transduction histidine kinase